MKKGNLKSLVLLGGVLALPAYAEKVQLEQLPSHVQDKIRAQTGGNRVEDIDRSSKDGKTVYEVAFKENGQHREIQVEDAAPTTTTTSTASSSVDSRKISYNELPENVKRVADQYVQGGEVNDVDRQVRNGRTTYEIGYKRDNGSQQELLIADNGQLLSNTSTSVATSGNSSSSSSSTTVNTIPGGDRVRGGDRINWGRRGANASASTRSMAWTDLPAAVKQTSNARLKDGDVKHVHRIVQNGNVIYQLDFEREDGKWQQLVVAEDGRAMSDQIVPASSVGAPASVQSGSASSALPSNTVSAPVALSSAQTLSRSQLPNAVAQAMRGYTTSGNIVQIQRGTWNGREIYDVTYRENNNQITQVQFDQSGSVVYDPRQSNVNSNTGTPTQNLLNNIGRLLDNNN